MQQQMKLMQYIAPLMVGFFGWNYAAGLALYWTISSVFAMCQQYFVSGWGSLLVKPNLNLGGGNTSKANSNSTSKNYINDRSTNGNGNSGKSYTGDRANETKIL